MPDPLITFPDVELLVVDFLETRAELTGVTVDNKVPAGFDGTTQAVLVSRVGGVWIDDEHLDTPLVDLEAYGPDKTAAHAVARLVRAVLLPLRGTVRAGTLVTDITELDGPRWLPDYNRPNANRYLTTVRLSLRPG